MKIIDAHSHYMPPEVAQKTAFFKVNWSDADRQLKIMDQHGIEKSLLLYPTSDAHIQMGGWKNLSQIYNEKIAELVQKFPDRLIGAGILPMDDPDAIPAALQQIEDYGFPFISLASSYDGKFLDEPQFSPIFEFASAKQIAIHVHSQILNPIGEERVRDPLLSPVLEYLFDVSMCIGKMMMSGLFLRYPKVKLIFAHYGGVLPLVKERFDTTYAMLRKREFVKDLTKNPSDYFKNLFFDTSGSRSIASLLCALEVTDSQHILFGSDFPANQKIAESIEVVQNSSFSSEVKEAVLGGNFENILGQSSFSVEKH